MEKIKYCLVTGSTGFIGQRLCQLLHEKRIRYRVTTRSQSSTQLKDSFFCNFENLTLPDNLFDSIDTVFHLAGVAHDSRSADKIESIYRKVNTDATLNLAQLAGRIGVKRFIFVSSVKAGGTPPQGVCIGEDFENEPEGIYGESKREAEIGLLAIGKQSGMHVSVVRPALVYGGDIKGNLKMMLNGIDKGWFPPIPQTFNRRTMIHIDDLIQALFHVAHKSIANGEIFNVTDGQQYSTRQIYNEMCFALGRKLPCWAVPQLLFLILAKTGDFINKFSRFPFDTYRYKKLLGDDCYSSDKICKLLDFRPIMTFADAMVDTVKLLARDKSL